MGLTEDCYDEPQVFIFSGKLRLPVDIPPPRLTSFTLGSYNLNE